MRTHRRTVAALAGQGIATTRRVYTTDSLDTVRVAALVEIASAAAALARTIVRLRHLDPDLIAPHVADPVDLRTVLGRGRWLPTMCRHVPAPPDGPVAVPVKPVSLSRTVRHRAARRGRGDVGQLVLFTGTGDR